MRKEYFFFFLVFCLMALGCRKPDEPKTYYVDKEMLKYCWFPVGSYWIYQEDGTPGWLDSVYISNPLHIVESVEGEDYISEGYSFDIILRGLRFRQGAQAEPIGSHGGSTLSYVSEFYSDSTGQVHDYLLFSNPLGGNHLPINPSTILFQEMDTIVIHGATYQDAIEIRSSPSEDAEFTTQSIWAKDVGVLHRSLVDGTSWSLVRHHINN